MFEILRRETQTSMCYAKLLSLSFDMHQKTPVICYQNIFWKEIKDNNFSLNLGCQQLVHKQFEKCKLLVIQVYVTIGIILTFVHFTYGYNYFPQKYEEQLFLTSKLETTLLS